MMYEIKVRLPKGKPREVPTPQQIADALAKVVPNGTDVTIVQRPHGR